LLINTGHFIPSSFDELEGNTGALSEENRFLGAWWMPRLASRQSSFSHALPNLRMQRLHTPFKPLVEPTVEDFGHSEEFPITFTDTSESEGLFGAVGSRLRPVGVITDEDEYNEFDDPIINDADQLAASIENETSRELETRQGKKKSAKYVIKIFLLICFLEWLLMWRRLQRKLNQQRFLQFFFL
jgi:hypothetical protein